VIGTIVAFADASTHEKTLLFVKNRVFLKKGISLI